MSILHETLNLLGRILLASYFIKAGINNSLHPMPIIRMLKSKNLPLPYVVYAMVLIIQVLGGLSVIFRFFPAIGALSLIGFTILSNILFLNYWTMEEKQARNISFLFYANIAVIGGLLLLI